MTASGKTTWNPPRELDRSSFVPLYYQLQEILKEEIEDERWMPGDLLPSESAIGSALGVSRPVIRKALDILQGDGQIIRVKGKGSIVAQPKLRYEAVASAASWQEGSVASPRLHRVVSVQTVEPGGNVARLLGVSPNAPIVELISVHSVGLTPSSLTHMFIRPDALPDLPLGEVPQLKEDGPPSIDQLASDYGLRITESRLTIEATRTNSFESDQLDMPREIPVFLLSSLDIRLGGEAVAFRRTIVRSDYFKFHVVVRNETTHGDTPGVLLEMTAPLGEAETQQ